MVASSIIHGLTYGVIFRVLSHLSLSETVLLAVLVSGELYVWNQDQIYRCW